MASANYASVLATTIAKATGWEALLAAELVVSPPALSLHERQALLAVASYNPSTGGGAETLVAARTIALADNGKTFFLGVAGGLTATLPLGSTLPLGWWCEFYATVTPTSDYVVATHATDVDHIIGHILSSSGGAEDTEPTAGGDQVNFVSAAGASKIGDFLRLKWDGTNWMARGECATAAGMTISG